AAYVVERIRKPTRRFADGFLINPSGRAPPPRMGGWREGVSYAEVRVLFFQCFEFVSIHNLVLAPIAVNEPDRDGECFVGRIFGHAFERRDPDPSRQEHGGMRFVQHEVANRAKDTGFVAGPQARERALVGGIREADRILRCGRVGLVASDIGRASMPSSVLSWRKVNCVARNAKISGFSSWIAWVVGVSGREDTTRTRKPLGGPSNVVTSNLHWPRPPRPYFVTS